MSEIRNVHNLKPVKTKIVCTLGPASTNLQVLEEMVLAGMDIVRLNFSHGEHEDHKKTLRFYSSPLSEI